MATIVFPGNPPIVFSGDISTALNPHGLVEIRIAKSRDGQIPLHSPVIALGPLEVVELMSSLIVALDTLCDSMNAAEDGEEALLSLASETQH